MPKIEDANVELMDDKQELMSEEKHELAVDSPQTDSHLSAFSGEVTSRDVSIPKIKLFHPQCAEAGDSIGRMGDVLFQGMVVGNESNPIETIVLSFTKTYVERLPYGTEERPRVYTTQAAYAEDGLTFKDIDETAKLVVLIAKPDKSFDDTSEEDMDFMFNVELAGKKWALGYLYVRGLQFKEAITPLTSFLALKGFENGFRPYRVKWTPLVCSRKSSPNTKFAKWKTAISRGSEGQLEEVMKLPFAEALA